VTTISSCHSLA